MPENTVEAWRNLWFHTGDALRRDAEGWYYFVDRRARRRRRGRGRGAGRGGGQRAARRRGAVGLLPGQDPGLRRAAVRPVRRRPAQDPVREGQEGGAARQRHHRRHPRPFGAADPDPTRSMTVDLSGSSTLVTGGASGLGRATAEALAGHGAYVTIVDLPASNGAELADKLGSRARFAAADVTSTAQMTEALHLAERSGPLRAVVHCAGRAPASGWSRRAASQE